MFLRFSGMKETKLSFSNWEKHYLQENLKDNLTWAHFYGQKEWRAQGDLLPSWTDI